mgnify:FL=1
MADVRLAIQVDASGAVRSVKTFNDELGKTPDKARDAGGALGSLRGAWDSVLSGFGAGGGLGLFNKAFEAVSATARLLGPDLLTAGQAATNAERSFRALARTAGIDSVAMLETARASTRGLVSDTALMSAANKALLLGLPVTAQQFGTLATSAQALGRAMGQDATKSLDDLITGLGRGSAQILDNLGIVVKAEDANAQYAASIGKTAGQLTEAEKKVAVYNAALLSMGANVERLGAQELTLADRYTQAKTTLTNLYEAAGQAINQSPALVSAFEAVAEAVGVAFGSGPQKMVETFTSWFNALAISAVDIANKITTALHGIGLAAVGMAELLVRAGDPFQLWTKGILAGLEKQRAIYKASYTEQMNALDALSAKMLEAIENQSRLNALGASGPLKSAGAGGSSPAASADAGRAQKVVEQAISGIYQAWQESVKRLWSSVDRGSALPGVLNQAANQDFAFRAVNSGWGDLSKSSDRLWSSVTNPGKGMLETIFPDYKKQKEASLTASQALQNLANIAALSGSKLAKGLAGIFGGASGVSAGLSSLKSMSGLSGLTGLLGKAGAFGSIAASVIGIGSSLFGLFKKKPAPAPPEAPKQASAESWRSFVGDQQSKGAAGVLAGVSGIRITSEADMMAQASIASQTFWATFKSQGLMKAAEMFRGVRDKMLETFKSFGASDETIAALLGPMSQVVDLAGNDAFKGAADGANGFAEALASIVNTQMPMSIEQFRAFESQAVSGYEQMKQAALDQGLSMEDAIKTAAQGSAQYLQTLQDAATRYGFNLDSSKAVFDAASASGLSLGMDSQDRLILSLDKLTETLGGTPPKFEAALTAGANAAGSRMSDAAFATGGGRGDASAIGDAVGQKIGLAMETLRGELRSQPITVNFPPIQMDGQAVAAGLAVVVDRGGYGGSRLTTAISESL